MYYYIFEPPLEAKEYERTAAIKEHLSSLGIAGEMVSPTANRTVEDLVQLAVAKRYSTIIAVGGMELINRTARSLEPYDVVFGIIPLAEHPDIASLIGTSDWRQASEHLKRRRWTPVRLGLLNNSACFLTPATLSLPESCGFELQSETFSARGQGTTIRIIPKGRADALESFLQIELEVATPKKSFLQNLFNRNSSMSYGSLFSGTSFTLITDTPQPVQVAGAVLAQTPIRITPQEKPVKLIVAQAPAEE